MRIIFTPADRSRWFFLLQEGVERFGHRINAFCFMNNHIHLAIQVAYVPLSKIIQNVSFRYTRWMNWQRQRVGHLFQGRFKALLVDKDNYLVELVRYIHLKPVRVGIVSQPEDYHWNSHRCYIGVEEISWLTVEWVLGQFEGEISKALQGYARFVRDGLGGEHEEKFHRGSENDSRALGDDVFLDRILNRQQPVVNEQLFIQNIEAVVCQAYSLH